MRRLTILIAALALVAAACGSGETSEAFVSPSTTATTVTPASDQPSTTATAPTTTAPSTGATTTTTPPSTPAALPESDYPDVTVADLAGGEVNLREFALEAEPVLLWFWAPH